MTENKLKYNNARMSDREWDETTNRVNGSTPGTDDDLDFPITGRTRWNSNTATNGYVDPNLNPGYNNGMSTPWGTQFGTPYGSPYNNLYNNNLHNMTNTPYGLNRGYGSPFTNTQNGNSFNSMPFTGTPYAGRSLEMNSVYNTPWQTPNGNSWPTGTPWGSVYSHVPAPFSGTWVPGLPTTQTNGSSPYSSLHTMPYTNQVPGFTTPGTWGTTMPNTFGTPPMTPGFTAVNTPLSSYSSTNRGKGPKSYQRSDESITENICNLLCEDVYVDATDIEVVVDNGEVTLVGTVESREVKRYVEDICECVTGVCNVENRLRINSERFQTKSTTTTTDSKTKRSTLTTASVS